MALSPGTRLGHYNVTALLGGSVRPVLRVALSVLVAMSLLVPDRVAAQTDADRAEATARGFDGSLAEGHFAVFWRTREGTVEHVRRILADAEAAFDGISRIVGVERTPTRRIVLILAGPGQAPDGTWRTPNVDDRGRVMLFRYGDDMVSYGAEVAHELVHAFRRHSGDWLSGFVEEGFAEAVAMEVDPDEVGFPRYGNPLVVVAGHLFARSEALPLSQIRARHRELNSRCRLQAYVERAAFFDYLKRTSGIDALVKLVYRSSEPTDADYVDLFGQPFAGLVERWESDLLAAYRNHPRSPERRCPRKQISGGTGY